MRSPPPHPTPHVKLAVTATLLLHPVLGTLEMIFYVAQHQVPVGKPN
jgi:hypothetical protein